MLPAAFGLQTLRAESTTPEEDRDALARCFKPAPPETPPFSGTFSVRPNETLTLIGGASVHEMQRYGFFETLLQLAFPGQNLKVRNIAWPADTVFRQQRPLYFYTPKGDTKQGSVPDQREKIEAGILVMQFGKLESLESEAGLPAFKDAYAALIDQLKPLTPRIVLASPTPFFNTWPIEEVYAARNTTLEAYVKAIESLAKEKGLLYVDVFHAIDPALAPLSRDGVQLTEAGQRQTAEALAKGLGVPTDSEKSGPLLDSAQAGDVRHWVIRKNSLWHQYYQPTNWAFLFGDRQHVPSSRDHIDTDRRWFVEEVSELPGMIGQAEEEVHKRSLSGN